MCRQLGALGGPYIQRAHRAFGISTRRGLYHSGKRTRRAAARIPFPQTSWDDSHATSFYAVKAALHTAATLAHPDESKLLCLFTDASDKHWAAVLTQIPAADLDLPCVGQRPASLSFLSGSFRKSTFSRCTPEREAFAIFEVVARLDYILNRPSGFWLFTDHKNLTFLFNPLATFRTISKNVLTKIDRSAIRLSAFQYNIACIPGEDNVWADLLSR